ncbi:hypothetical protein V5O48_001821 [Marasmius crinis-equi]|uniref:DUF2470 domain-containing protein n=1 Tax=Marasmius crinis-equi TaxID=585013 RepID=A0ABR3FXU9_9AGAR
MTDPVSEKSAFLCMYMTSHPDTLVAYAKWYGKVAEPITSAKMTSIDSKGMDLTCTLKNGSQKPVRVVIDPPLSGYDDVKPRLLEMKAHAQEGLGMIKAPVISTYEFTPGVLGGVAWFALLAYFSYAPKDSSPLYLPAQLASPYLGRIPEILLKLTFGLHVLESLYTTNLCRKHQTGLIVGLQYVISTLLGGIGVILPLRKRIQNARIDSVMKVE